MIKHLLTGKEDKFNYFNGDWTSDQTWPVIYRTGEFSDSVDSLFLTQSCFNTSGFDANSSSKIAKKFCSIQIYV